MHRRIMMMMSPPSSTQPQIQALWPPCNSVLTRLDSAKTRCWVGCRITPFPSSPLGRADFGVWVWLQLKKSPTSLSPGKGAQIKGYAGANQSKLGTSKIIFTADMKAEKMNISAPKAGPQVYDMQGVDVTPRPLFHPDPAAAAKPNKLLTSQEGSFTSEFISSYILFQNTMYPSMFGQFTRSILGSSSKSSVSTIESDDLEEPSFKRDRKPSSYTDLRVIRAAPGKITKKDLEETVDILLTDTETIIFLNLPTVVFSTVSEEAERVLQKNRNYENLCKNRIGNDLYVERMMQTINESLKNKDVQCDKIIKEDKGIMSTSWDLYDSFNALEILSVPARRSPADTRSKGNVNAKDWDPKLSPSELEKSGESSLMDMENVILAKVHDEEEDQIDILMKSEKFQQNLFFMERVLMENIFQPKLAAYRQLPIFKEREPEEPEKFLGVEKVEEIQEESKREEDEELEINAEPAPIPANLERLWSFSCDLTKGLNVSSLAWNKTNPDLLAVGYGHFGFKEQKKGLACCWSLKNPMWPERIYQSPHGVTSVDFSIGSPNLLAVGHYNGSISIYNVQNNSNNPVLDSSESPHKHWGPIWQLQWIEQDRGTTGDDKREILVSIAADGRISKWVIRKGLGAHDLMRLKRTSFTTIKKGLEKEKKGEALISRQAPGMCFAFHPKDTNIYLAGTEEGHIHKCSCSYNEQYLDTYRGHKGPVYKITWNPFCSDVFLSCSADWGIIIWQQENLKPFLSFYPTTYVVYDVAWSPKSSFIFAAANESRVEVWDLRVSILDPLIVYVANPGIKFTTVLFAKHTDCLLVGDSDGQVAVYELRNMPVTLDTVRSFTNEDHMSVGSQDIQDGQDGHRSINPVAHIQTLQCQQEDLLPKELAPCLAPSSQCHGDTSIQSSLKYYQRSHILFIAFEIEKQKDLTIPGWARRWQILRTVTLGKQPNLHSGVRLCIPEFNPDTSLLILGDTTSLQDPRSSKAD
ncbi:dynein axonemal intermediate chain 4 [Suncus etruscus]|uniref:dynein axonemal intermediate chain 4 n=1 Tax=Suncus etruscus TaxID=109475 RepID=UPI00210FE84F|nr:dynein axonemal intermediate chain 4 [Suncus etruscus]